MNRLLQLFLLLVPFFAFSQQSDSAIVDKLNRDWIASYATRDTATMQQILADDFVMISPKGGKLTRMDVIRNIGSADMTTTASIDSASIRIFGQTALVVAYTHFTVESKSKILRGSNCYSDVYIKRKGKWKAVAAHVTLLTMN